MKVGFILLIEQKNEKKKKNNKTGGADLPKSNKPLHDKTNNFGFQSGPTQTGLYSH